MPRRALPPLPALFLLTAIFYCNFFARIVFAPLLPAIEHSLSLSHGQAGAFFLIISCGYFISLLLSGFISSRFSHKMTITLSMFSLSVALLLIATLTDLLFLRLAFFILGLAAGLFLPSAISTISDLFSPRHWGRAFAVHELAPNLAFLTAPLFASLAQPAAPWTLIVFTLAACSLAAALLYSRLGHGAKLYGEPPNLALCGALVARKDFMILVILFAAGISGTIGIFNTLPLFLVTNHGMTIEQANLIVGLSRASSLVTALLGGFLADYFGNRRTIAGVLLLTGISTFFLGVAEGSTLIISVFVQPILAVCFFPAGFALLSRLSAPESRNVVISLAVPLAFVIGGGALPSLVAFMADYGLFAAGLSLTGLLIGTAALLVRSLNSGKSN